jgi:hypothetical protein
LDPAPCRSRLVNPASSKARARIFNFGIQVQTSEGFYLASVADLVRMKLTSYRLKDKVHIQDMDGVGLITAEIEADLPDVLLSRLHEIRVTE